MPAYTYPVLTACCGEICQCKDQQRMSQPCCLTSYLCTCYSRPIRTGHVWRKSFYTLSYETTRANMLCRLDSDHACRWPLCYSIRVDIPPCNWILSLKKWLANSFVNHHLSLPISRGHVQTVNYTIKMAVKML